MKSSENMVLEAMFRLSGLHDALEELLRAPILPHGPSRYTTLALTICRPSLRSAP